MPRAYRFWSAGELHRLEELYLAGRAVSAIAAALNRTPSAVHWQAHALGLRRPHLRAQLWLEVFTVPHTYRQVAQAMGVSAKSARQAKQRLRRAGFSLPAAAREAS